MAPSPTKTPTPLLIPHPLPTPLPPTLRAPLQSRIVTSNTVPSILSALRSACATSGWEDAIRARVLELLREGEVKDTEELLRRVVGEVRGVGGEEVGGKKDGNNGKGKGRGDLRVPEAGIKEGTRIVRGVLDGCVEIEPERDFWAA